MDEFVLRTNEWVIWNRSGWKGPWINLAITPIFKPGCTNRYYIGWNGDLFSLSSELERAKKKFGPEIAKLEIELRALLRK